MPGPDLSLDSRNLLAATCDSCRLLAFSGEFLECAAVTINPGFFAAQGLPALHDHVHILGVQFDAVTDPLGEFRGSQSGSRSQERVENQFATL